jgi:membrane protease YdiL (CAAX protease family)
MWERINKFVHSHAILSTFLLGVIFFTALVTFAALATETPVGLPPGASELALFTLAQVVLSAIVIYLMRKLNVFSMSDFKFQNMGKGFLLGWVAFVGSIIVFVMTLSQMPPDSFVVTSIPHLLIVIFHPILGTGFFEEVLFRGLILKLLLVAFGDSKKEIVKAAVISSVLFGAAHIVNAFFGGGLLPTISQFIYATATGIFFAALYLRTGTLWIPIILHALINFASQIFGAIVPQEVFLQLVQIQTDPSVLEFIISTLFMTVPYLVAGLVLLRKVKPNESTDEIS